MTTLKHNCPICKDRDINTEGIKLASDEVIPFIKNDLLKLRYPNHPFPRKYKGLLESIYCYSQALLFNRLHSEDGIFYTTNKWMLSFTEELAEKFGMPTKHEKHKPDNYSEACEYNTRV